MSARSVPVAFTNVACFDSECGRPFWSKHRARAKNVDIHSIKDIY